MSDVILIFNFVNSVAKRESRGQGSTSVLVALLCYVSVYAALRRLFLSNVFEQVANKLERSLKIKRKTWPVTL